MAHLRFEALKLLNERPRMHMDLPAPRVSDYFGENVFTADQMRASLSPSVFKKVSKAIKFHEKIDEDTADAVASTVKSWALSKGATHFTHWFQPLTGGTAEKHDSFFDAIAGIEKFKGSGATRA